MMTKPDDFRALSHDLNRGMWAAAAIGVLFEHGLAEHLREPRTIEELFARRPGPAPEVVARCLDLAATLGVVVREGARYRLAEGALPFTQSPMREGMMGNLRSNLMQALALLDAPVGGWRHTSRALLQSQGDASSVLAPLMKGMIAPNLDGLTARLEQPGARFLDVGVGVAALAIAMCRAFPAVRAVGIDSSDTPLSIARENVASAGMTDRIELRKTGVHELAEEGAFDLAWLPSFFVDTAQIRTAVARIHASLRPGGWVICGTDTAGVDERDRATWALIRTMWGGAEIDAAAAEKVLAGAGFTSVRTLPLPPTAPAMVVGRR